MKKALIILLCLCSLATAADKPYRVQNSFNAGELSPLLNAREDLSKYHAGLAVMENMIPLPQGAAQKRPGTVYVAESKNNTKIRMLPFEFSTEQSYAIEAGNQYKRFFTDKSAVTAASGTEDLSSLDNIVAHWLLNDNLHTTAVLDDDGNTHDGIATTNTRNLYEGGKVGYGCFNFNAANAVEIADHGDFSFGDGANDSAFTIAAWIYVKTSNTIQTILSKYDTGSKREWMANITSANVPYIILRDESAPAIAYSTADDALTTGWHFIVFTYDGTGGAGAHAGIIIYVDGSSVAETSSNSGAYVAMENLTAKVVIGASYVTGTLSSYYEDRIDNVALFSDVLSPSEVSSLYTASTIYEISTPYLTADLFELKYEQSADVLYITHPDYEPRKLLRWGNAIWSLDAFDAQTGPFRDQNTDNLATIAANGTTGSVTLTATGCAPFVDGTTAGHEPSGSLATSKSQTGALFKLVHPLDTLEYSETLSDNYTDDQTENTSWMDCGTVYKGSTWYLTTLGTWTGVLHIQRNYTIGAAHDASGWEDAMKPFASADDRNVTTNGTESIAAASYRAILIESGDAAEPCKVYFSTNQTEHIGIVEITAVTSSVSATATVLTTLASTNATHKWSEGAWSNYRGWPRAVTFFEDRLVFGGNASQPDTIWASVTSDYENMTEGAEDDEALLFTLSSRQVNVIEWLISKNKLLIGTSGAEWTISGGPDEPLTPSNVKAEQHSTYGSANLQAILASESVLFFQRGAEKMRELAYNWETDAYVAPEMTLLVPEITGEGITDVAYQQTPNSILWCIRDDGEMAIFIYERAELITSWSRLITDGYFESVAVINGDPEDEVWVSVNRTIGGSTVRYIEYFAERDFGDDVDDAFFVDSGITYDSTATTTITGLTHLNAETVAVLGDGAVQDSQTVSSGQITITSASTVQVGLPFTVQMRTMPLSYFGTGSTIHGRIRKISQFVVEYYKSGDFDVGRNSSTKNTLSLNGMATDVSRNQTFPPGIDRQAQIFIYQQSPEPLTLVALMLEFMVY